MTLIRARHRDAAGPAGIQVHVSRPVLPALVHQRNRRGRLQLRHHRRVDRADLATVGDDVRRADDTCGLLVHQVDPVGHPGELGQPAGQGRKFAARGVAGRRGQCVDVRTGHGREDRGHHIGAARRLSEHHGLRKVQLAPVNGRLHQPDQAPRIETGLGRTRHVLPTG